MDKFARIIKRIALVYVIIVGVYALFSMFTVVTYPNQYTVVKQFGKVIDIRSNEDGKTELSFKIPILNSTHKLPNTLIMYDLPVSNVITSDKKTMVADCFACFPFYPHDFCRYRPCYWWCSNSNAHTGCYWWTNCCTCLQQAFWFVCRLQPSCHHHFYGNYLYGC